jgi:hypothetical protein
VSTTLDGQRLFNEQQLEIKLESIQRDFVGRSIAGLDGLLSVDLGKRSRRIKQKGTLRAKSRLQLKEKIDAISKYLDGKAHKLVTDSDRELDDVRMDSFEFNNEKTAGSGVCCDYIIVYTQLKV